MRSLLNGSGLRGLGRRGVGRTEGTDYWMVDARSVHGEEMLKLFSEIVDTHVGLLDTHFMTNNVLASSERHHRQESAVGMSDAFDEGTTYDAFGMPMSLAAAKSMTEDAILAALRMTLAKLHHESPEPSNSSAKIDSIEVVFLVGRFFRDLDCEEPDLSTIDRDSWSNLKGVAGVLFDAVWKLK